MYEALILGLVLLLTLYVLKHERDPKLNLPPLVHYKFPIIGHTYSYMTNCEEFLKQCSKEYGDIFSLYVWGQVKTFIGKEHFNEIFARDDVFDFSEVFNRIFPGDVMLKSIGQGKVNPNKILKEYVLNKLKSYSERMQRNLYLSNQKLLGDCIEPKVYNNIYHLMTKIISKPIASILIGEEESKYDEVITAFANFTSDAAIFFVIPPIFNFIYPGAQSYIIRMIVKLGLYNPAIKHQKVLMKHIKNQVSKRLEEKKKYGDSWKRPEDFLQDFIEAEGFDDPDKINYPLIVDIICIYIFVSVHTTSRSCANVIMDLASRPEYMQELYQEQLKVHEQADEDGLLPFDALKDMKKLDSFVRESLRLVGNISGLSHLVLKDYTFSNGLQVPEGRIVDIYFNDIYQDESLQGSNPKSFEPFRHVAMNNPASKLTKNYLPFGSGKHACPGRYLATNEIKFFMHNLILKYNFRTESGKIEEKRRFGPLALPSNNGVIFEKRKN